MYSLFQELASQGNYASFPFLPKTREETTTIMYPTPCAACHLCLLTKENFFESVYSLEKE